MSQSVKKASASKKSDHDRYRSASYGWTTLSARQSAADFAKSCGTYACTARFGVGVDAGHSRSRRRSVTDVGLPLAGTHRPGRLHRFYGNLRRIRNFQAGRCRHRPLQSRSFQASTDKMLCFQGMFSFRRKRPSFLNCCGTIENTGQTGFFGFTGDSSQIVVMQLPVAEKLFQE